MLSSSSSSVVPQSWCSFFSSCEKSFCSLDEIERRKSCDVQNDDEGKDLPSCLRKSGVCSLHEVDGSKQKTAKFITPALSQPCGGISAVVAGCVTAPPAEGAGTLPAASMAGVCAVHPAHLEAF